MGGKRSPSRGDSKDRDAKKSKSDSKSRSGSPTKENGDSRRSRSRSTSRMGRPLPTRMATLLGTIEQLEHILNYSRAFFLFSHNKQIVHKIPLVTNLYIQLRNASYTYQVYKTVCRDNKVSTLNNHHR